jgi:hypothetical protein
LEISVLSLFAVETILRGYAMGLTVKAAKRLGYDPKKEHKGYCNDSMCKMDLVVIVVDLISIILTAVQEHATSSGSAAQELDLVKTLRVLRLLRFARLLRLRRVLRQGKLRIHAARNRKRKDFIYEVTCGADSTSPLPAFTPIRTVTDQHNRGDTSLPEDLITSGSSRSSVLPLVELKDFARDYAVERMNEDRSDKKEDHHADRKAKGKEEERFFTELLDGVLVMAKDGFYSQTDELWRLCSPLIALLDEGRIHAARVAQPVQQGNRSVEDPPIENQASTNHTVVSKMTDVDNPMVPAELVPASSSRRLVQQVKKSVRQQVTNSLRQLGPEKKQQQSTEKPGAEAVDDDAEEEQTEMQKRRYNINASTNTESSSKRKILNIMGVVSQLRLDLRLSQLLFMQKQGTIGSRNSRYLGKLYSKSKSRSSHREAKVATFSLSKRVRKYASGFRLWLLNPTQSNGALDSGFVLGLIMVLVLGGIFTSAIAETYFKGYEHDLAMYELVVLVMFSLEALLRMFAMGPRKYLGDSMCFMDLVVIFCDALAIILAQYIHAENGTSAVPGVHGSYGSFMSAAPQAADAYNSSLGNVKALRALRLLRFARLLRLRRVYKAALERLSKKEKHETMSKTDFEKFEELFKKEERSAKDNADNFGAVLQLSNMSKREPLTKVCLDVLMYQHDSLFEAAFETLQQQFCQRKAVVTAMRKVQLVPKAQESELVALETDLHVLRQNTSSFAIWTRRLGSSDGSDEGEAMITILGKLSRLCTTQPRSEAVSDTTGNNPAAGLFLAWTEESKEKTALVPATNSANLALLEKLGVHGVVMQAMRLHSPRSTDAGSVAEIRGVHEIVAKIQTAAAEFLREFANNNARGQQLGAEHMMLFVDLAAGVDQHQRHAQDDVTYTPLAEAIDELLMSLVQENCAVCDGLSQGVLQALASLLARRVTHKRFSPAERLIRLFTQIFMHKEVPVQALQERVMIATTTRAIKTACFEPFLTRMHRKDEPAFSYQITVIDYFGSLCVGQSAMCEAKCQALLPLATVLEMINNFAREAPEHNEVSSAVVGAWQHSSENGISTSTGSKSEDENYPANLDPVDVEPQGRARTMSYQAYHSDNYQARGALTRFLAECYFETDVSEDGELLQNEDLWAFIQNCSELIQQLLERKSLWRNKNFLDCTGMSIFALTLFYDNVYDDASFHGKLLMDLFVLLRSVQDPGESSQFANLPQTLADSANGVACYNYACVLADEMVKLLASKKWVDHEACGVHKPPPAGFPAWVASRRTLRGSWTIAIRPAMKAWKVELQKEQGPDLTNITEHSKSKLALQGAAAKEQVAGRRSHASPVASGDARPFHKEKISLDGIELVEMGEAAPQPKHGIQRHFTGWNDKRGDGTPTANTAIDDAKKHRQQQADDMMQQQKLHTFAEDLCKSFVVRKALELEMDAFAQFILDVEVNTYIDPHSAMFKNPFRHSSQGLVISAVRHARESLTRRFSRGSRGSVPMQNQPDSGEVTVEHKVMLQVVREVTTVKQEDLVARMVKYVRDQIQYSAALDEGVCSGVLSILRHCLVFRRRELLPRASNWSVLRKKQAIKEMARLQTNFAKFGVAKAVVDVVASVGTSHVLIHKALKLGNELAAGGSIVVQHALFQYLKESRSESFFENIREHINREIDRLKQLQIQNRDDADGADGADAGDDGWARGRARSSSSSSSSGALGAQAEEGGDGEADDDEEDDDDDADDRDGNESDDERLSANTLGEGVPGVPRRSHIKPIMKFMQLMCENHNDQMQKAMREQEESCGNATTVNLVEEAVRLVECMAKKERLLDMLDNSGMETLHSVFEFLIECAQGPCFENQETLVKSELAECCKSILTGLFKRLKEQLGASKATRVVEKLQGRAMKLLVSLVEGRNKLIKKAALASDGQAVTKATDMDGAGVHRMLGDKLETSLLRLRLINNHEKIRMLEAGDDDAVAAVGSGHGQKKKQTKKKQTKKSKEVLEDRKQLVLGEVRDMLALVEHFSDISAKFKTEMEPSLGLHSKAAEASEHGDHHESSQSEARLAQDEKQKYYDAHRYFYSQLQRVEIVWNGHLERLLFVRPTLCEMHTRFDREQSMKELNYQSPSRMKEFMCMNKKQLQELQLTQSIKSTHKVVHFVAENFHMLPSLVCAVAVIINVTLMLSARFPASQHNAWITNTLGKRVWNTNTMGPLNATTRPDGASSDEYGRPWYPTDEGRWVNGTYEGPETLVSGTDTVQDNLSGQRATTFAWGGSLGWGTGSEDWGNVEDILLALGWVHLVLQLVALSFRVGTSMPIVYEDIQDEAATFRAGAPSCTDDENQDDDKYADSSLRQLQTDADGVARNHHNSTNKGVGGAVASDGNDKTLWELTRECFSGLTLAALVTATVLLLLQGRSGGRVPGVFVNMTFLLVPNFMICLLRLLKRWKPWARWPLDPLPTPKDGTDAVTVMQWVEWLSECDVMKLLSKTLFWYTVTMDVVLYKDNLHYAVYSAIGALAVSGYPFAYCLLLLLVIKTNKPMQTVMKALKAETVSMIASTMLLVVIVVYIFSGFAFFFLNGDLYSQETGSECDTMVGCVITLFHTELMSGGFMEGKFAESWEEGGGDPNGLLFLGWDKFGQTGFSGQYLTVMLFEIAFYTTVIVVLLNMVFGIIIDRFAELRDDKRENDLAMRSTCFVCGITKAEFDNEGLKKNELEAFDHHIHQEHHMWSYFQCQVYILTKDKTELTGAESFLHRCLEEDNTEWVPIQKALRFENTAVLGAGAGEGEDGGGADCGAEDNVASVTDVLKEDMKGLRDELQGKDAKIDTRLATMEKQMAEMLALMRQAQPQAAGQSQEGEVEGRAQGSPNHR